jgi:2-dehydro-3-deoxygluconokinase
MIGRVVTFGEIMLRLSPPGHRRFVQAESFDAQLGGAEANVAVMAAALGNDALFVSKVPDTEIGQMAINRLRGVGVRTDHIRRGGERLGIYFVEMGASQRPSRVIYDRAHSSISGVVPGEFDWNGILDGAKWLHVTGITPALGDGPAAVTIEAVKAAKARGVKTSVDLNFRKKLWSPQKARAVMSEIAARADVIMANEEDAEQVFGIRAADSEVVNGKLSEAGYREVAQKLRDRFGAGLIAITLRESLSASDNNWSALCFDGASFHRSRVYPIHIVDRLGGGDAFSGALIHALLEGKPLDQATEFAVAASCLKHSLFGDFNLVTRDEVEALASGPASGRIQR